MDNRAMGDRRAKSYAGKGITIVFKEHTKSGKTSIYNVTAKAGNIFILRGQIRWEAHWRAYVYTAHTEFMGVYDSKCLGALKNFIEELMELREILPGCTCKTPSLSTIRKGGSAVCNGCGQELG